MELLDTIVRDVRYVLRTMRYDRSFTVTAVLTLGLAAISVFGPVEGTEEGSVPKATGPAKPIQMGGGLAEVPKDKDGRELGQGHPMPVDPKGNVWVFHRCFNVVPAGQAT